MDGGENEAMSIEQYLALRIENSERVKLGQSENERMVKVKIKACVRIENVNESFNPV